jgi:signal peptidase I
MRTLVKEIKEWTRSLVIAVLIFLFITLFGDVTQVYGQSMEPTLHQDDHLVFSKLSHADKGDIVILESEIELTDQDLSHMNVIQRWKTGEYKPLINRIVAEGGDEIRIQNGVVTVNGVKLDESYLDGMKTPGDIYIEEIPEGYYFVMGDNRKNSLDSRSTKVGLVSENQIKGKVLVRFFPLDDFSML